MLKTKGSNQSGFSIVEILIFLIVIIAIGGIGYWRLSSSSATSIDTNEDYAELESEVMLATPTRQVALATTPLSNKIALIEQFNVLTLSNLSTTAGTAQAKASSLIEPPQGSDFITNKKIVTAAPAPYLYYLPKYIDPFVMMYSSLKQANISTVNIPIAENGVKVAYPTSKVQYINYATQLADIVTTTNLFDHNNDGDKEWKWNAVASDPNITSCRGRDKVVVNQLCTLRATRTLSSLAATIKSDPELNIKYGAKANAYVKFIKDNILKNVYYKSEYDPNANYGHNRAIFLNAQAADTLLNMYIASNKTATAEELYLKDAKKIASNLREATLGFTMNNEKPVGDTIYLGVNKRCTTLTNNLLYYNLFQSFAAQKASDGDGNFSCLAADTSHLNTYIQMVANFKNNGFIFGDNYVNKIVNTLNDIMWKEWIDPSLPNAKLNTTYNIYLPFTSDVVVKSANINTIGNFLYKSNIDWPKTNVLKGKQIVMTCPSGSATSKVINVTGNDNTTIYLLGMSQFDLKTDTTCKAVLYDKAYLDSKGNLTGRIVNKQFSDFSNGYNLTIRNNYDGHPNPNYAPGSLGQNFAEWNTILTEASISNPNTNLARAKAAKAFQQMSPDAKEFYLTQAILW